ncbi:MAG: hypothetical protein RJA70_4653 [Pseudomonadota bacterium]|jgi:hypothetical protein
MPPHALLTSSQATLVAELRALFDWCYELTSESLLKAVHGVDGFTLTPAPSAAAPSANLDWLSEGLFATITTWGYHRHPDARLRLEARDRFPIELLHVPLDDFAPNTAAATELRALRGLLIETLASVFSTRALLFRLDPYDTSGNTLHPAAGLSTYYVLIEDEFGILLDFCWDS